MAIPFAVDQAGNVAQQQAPITQLQDRVTALVGTLPGQRVMSVGFGVALAHLLFTPGNEIRVQATYQQIADALRVYEPSARLVNVTPISDASGTGVSAVLATATPAAMSGPNSSAVQSVFIAADGSVVDFASAS
jgi:phage baseplate assembly protein W